MEVVEEDDDIFTHQNFVEVRPPEFVEVRPPEKTWIPLENIECFKCHQKGHLASSCPIVEKLE